MRPTQTNIENEKKIERDSNQTYNILNSKCHAIHYLPLKKSICVKFIIEMVFVIKEVFMSTD